MSILVYSVPGSAQQVSQLKTLFDCGMDLDLRTKSTSELDPHAVASLFKAWLRECALLSRFVFNDTDSFIDYSTGINTYTGSRTNTRSAHVLVTWCTSDSTK